MEINVYAVVVAALVPVALRYVWHSIIGEKTRNLASGQPMERTTLPKAIVVLAVSLLLSMMLAFHLNFVVNHETHVYSLFMNKQGQIDEQDGLLLKQVMDSVGRRYRYWQHGALHGVIAALLFAFPIIGLNGIQERKSWKYIFLQSGFWTLCMTIMGAIICAWVK